MHLHPGCDHFTSSVSSHNWVSNILALSMGSLSAIQAKTLILYANQSWWIWINPQQPCDSLNILILCQPLFQQIQMKPKFTILMIHQGISNHYSSIKNNDILIFYIIPNLGGKKAKKAPEACRLATLALAGWSQLNLICSDLILISFSMKKLQMQLIAPLRCVASDLISILHLTIDRVNLAFRLYTSAENCWCVPSNKGGTRQQPNDKLRTHIRTQTRVHCPEILQADGGDDLLWVARCKCGTSEATTVTCGVSLNAS